MSTAMWRRLVGAVLLSLALAAPATAQSPADGTHLGVQSCAGDNCHGRVTRMEGVRVQQNEYLIWSQKDKHARAYAVLKDARSLRIAKNLGLPDAEHAPLCLNCHADNVAPDHRGRQFEIADGVGCEACHGGASTWLGIHLTDAGHQANIAAGMVATDRPQVRAEKCLSCHIGGSQKFVTHQIMGAGHPPMPFELDTFTAIQPAHFVVNAAYIESKGQPNDMQIWAIGQAADVRHRMDLLLDPKNTPKGVDFELSLFDCQACHHSMSDLQWQSRAATGLPPGRIKLYDATLVMLDTIAERVAPDAAKALSAHMLALHKATGEGWDAVRREATAVRDAATALIPALEKHQFDKDDAKALFDAVLSGPVAGNDFDYSGAQQRVNALESIVAATKALGFADDKQLAALDQARAGLYAAVADDQKYRPEGFAEALKAFKAKLPF
ncbi:MAG TPA: multiheme c-type cytochrome [Stellaceae bacterium]|nr:multiheme c-type cytochrome [Stellaceae bacterium]